MLILLRIIVIWANYKNIKFVSWGIMQLNNGSILISITDIRSFNFIRIFKTKKIHGFQHTWAGEYIVLPHLIGGSGTILAIVS